MSDPARRHNDIAPEIVKAILMPVIDADGSWSETVVILESVILGVILFIERSEGVTRRASVELVETLTERVLKRLSEFKEEAR